MSASSTSLARAPTPAAQGASSSSSPAPSVVDGEGAAPGAAPAFAGWPFAPYADILGLDFCVVFVVCRTVQAKQRCLRCGSAGYLLTLERVGRFPTVLRANCLRWLGVCVRAGGPVPAGGICVPAVIAGEAAPCLRACQLECVYCKESTRAMAPMGRMSRT